MIERNGFIIILHTLVFFFLSFPAARAAFAHCFSFSHRSIPGAGAGLCHLCFCCHARVNLHVDAYFSPTAWAILSNSSEQKQPLFYQLVQRTLTYNSTDSLPTRPQKTPIYNRPSVYPNSRWRGPRPFLLRLPRILKLNRAQSPADQEPLGGGGLW